MDRKLTVTVELDNGACATVTRSIDSEELKQITDNYTEEEVMSVITTICMREAMGASAQAIQLLDENVNNWWERESI